ncbi:uncharacterized protein LOC132259605 isoform X2 [Phlebotomus argentipes]|uniref:uncharacterized protein LOC132259605 isoform X2 n=1 Tax=Phlebotomus argentipes TaxID=94469 RepID=UPI002893154E|nr:uncharacterized protein LOC132259605 isoform X2 [Phlebotomus argentipes]XP_059613295.1 uncharacterized protein LOC132259605 isoform X2 [Phlebotomus argentipes]
MTKHSALAQIKQIDAIFGGRRNSEVKVIETQRSSKCNVHGQQQQRRGSSGSVNGKQPVSLNTILGGATTQHHVAGVEKRDSSAALKSLPTHIRNSIAHLDDRNYFQDFKPVSTTNRDSFSNGIRRTSMPVLNQQSKRRDSVNSSRGSPAKAIEHPSAFPSMLRSSTPTSLSRRNSTNTLPARKRSSTSVPRDAISSFGGSAYFRRESSYDKWKPDTQFASTKNLSNSRDVVDAVVRPKARNSVTPLRDFVKNGFASQKNERPNSILRSSIPRSDDDDDSSGSKLSRENLSKHVTILAGGNDERSSDRESSPEVGPIYRRESWGSAKNLRRISIDSLDLRRNSWDGSRRASLISGFVEPLQVNEARPKFVAVTSLEDVQAVRCAEFHPNGKVYAVGSNSKTFRICEYPVLGEIREEHTTYQPTVLFKRTKHHKGSIYCMAWSPQGDLVATGSNDKTVKLMRYNEVQQQLEGREVELTMHDGTVRDLCFIEDSTNKASLLISAGAGDCKIYVTDCVTSTPFQALSGHGGHVLSLFNWGGAMFVSGSQDKTVRFWDLRTRGCVNMVTPATAPGSRQGSPVAAVCVDPSGRLLVSGHEDSSCVLYDIRGNRPIQCFKPHAADIRSIRFSPSAYYLLTGGYDNKLVLTDLQGDLTMPLPSVVVAQHTDKVISGRWHPTDFSFLSTSADKTATLWALPPI